MQDASMPPKEHIAPFLPALHASRLRNGTVTADAIRSLAEHLGMPLADVYGAISFYHYPAIGEQTPPTRAVCRGPACSLAEPSHPEEDLRSIACPGRCDRPVPRYDGERFFTPGQTEPQEGAGLPIETGQEEALFRHIRRPNQRRLAQYRASGGYETLLRAVRQGAPEHTIAALEESGLLGRGGAAFPTAAKWRAVRAAPGQQKYLVCNADEGEPGTFKDRPILEYDPHLLLEGMALAGHAAGATAGIVYLRYEYPYAFDVLTAAIQQAEDAGFLGERIGGTDFSFWVSVARGAGSYVCGEETALLNSLEGKRPYPRERPPFPTTSGLWGQPTLINNVETLAAVRPILERGPQWFRGLGRGGSAGTKIYSVSGRVTRPGNYELPLGVTAGELILDYAGGPLAGRTVKGFTLGGVSGGLLASGGHLDLPLDYTHPRSYDAHLGSGGIIVLDDGCCAVDFVRTCLLFYESESCGKCFPCRIGTIRLREAFDGLTGRRQIQDGVLQDIQEIGSAMATASACGLGQAAPLVVAGLLRHFSGEVEQHLQQRRCPTGVCPW